MIVQQEQDANLISRLHGGKLEIIPWPVIESKEFYRLFATLKRRLDLQKVSHSTAGEFLHTIKALMAKLKVCVLFFLSLLTLLMLFLRLTTGAHFPVRRAMSLAFTNLTYPLDRNYGRTSC